MKSWSKEFVLGCGAISLLLAGAAAAQPAPAIALLDQADSAQWQSWAKEFGWRIIAPPPDTNASIDIRIQALEKAVSSAIQDGSVDSSRIYLAGREEAAAAVFYAISREPDLWAAGAALGGSPQPAIDSNRFYTANFTNVPVLWAGSAPDDRALSESLQSAGLTLDFRPASSVTAGMVLDWLGRHRRPEFPAAVDCETNSPSFAGCYWIRMAKFDAGERNDALASTRVQPALTASLDLGGFGFKKDDPGPGILVVYLPEKYSGPLKIGDRIVALDGREMAQAQRYIELMSQIAQERPAVVMVQRGKERIRLETRIVIPNRGAGVTARVQGRYRPEEHQIEIVSRAVTEMRVDVPAQWVPAILNWNGVPLENLDKPGCRLLTIAKAIQKAGPCE